MPNAIDHPYQELHGGTWLRGNLHNHPRPKDQPDQLAQRYAQFGYGFLALTEHDHTYLAADIRAWNHCGLVLIPGNEISANGQHILHVGAQRHIEPHADRQRVIDEIDQDGGFAVFNHPNIGPDFGHQKLDLMRALQGYAGLEIFNASGLRGTGTGLATDKWDILLSEGRRLWGFASDDYHQPSDAGRAWLVAYVKERSIEGVLTALHCGCFYASTGVDIAAIAVDGRHIRVESRNAQRIMAISDGGRGLALADATELEVYMPAEATYVRFECWGAGGRQAWTQPFFAAGV